MRICLCTETISTGQNASGITNGKLCISQKRKPYTTAEVLPQELRFVSPSKCKKRIFNTGKRITGSYPRSPIGRSSHFTRSFECSAIRFRSSIRVRTKKMPRPNFEEVLLVSCGQLGTPESFKRKPTFVRKLNHFERGRIQSLCRIPLIGHEMLVVWRPRPLGVPWWSK